MTIQVRELHENQITSGPRNHFLSPFGPFSPDDRWIVYDTRADETAMGSNPFIEKVNVHTGETVVLYQVPNQSEYGPGCGTPSYSPVANQNVFIHGLRNCDRRRPYGFSRRTAAMVDESQMGRAIFLDARDVTPPFTPGALRGGTHAHEWSDDGRWIGFTYNDAIMAETERRTGRAVDLRTVGVATPLRPVAVDKDPEGENNDGAWFSALVARVVPEPKPGSDEISRAFENAWVGKKGYRKPDGSWQRAQAYLGKMRTREGRELVEVFISEIPDRIDIPGPLGPLEGTEQDFPMPPKGVIQRRLTHTENRRYPGVSVEPRHWVFSSHDGRFIAFLAKDDAGVAQIFVVSPVGGKPIQVTHHTTPAQSTFQWHPTEYRICYVCDGSIFVCELDEGGNGRAFTRLTRKTKAAPICPVFSRNGKNIAYNRETGAGEKKYRQIFAIAPSE